MRLLLHACCGPCSLEPSRILREAGNDITVFYANSNIAPLDEYAHRLETLRTWAGSEGLAVWEGDFDPAAWQATAGRIGEAALAEVRAALSETAGEAGGESFNGSPSGQPEQLTSCATAALSEEERASLAVDPAKRAARCRACYRLRLEETARRAAEAGFDAISTTLSVSPYQYTEIIREELERAAGLVGVRAHFEDFRPYYDKATQRSRDLGMYRQNYCGCLLSHTEAAAERAERKAARAAERAAEKAAHAEERAAEEAARQARKTERAAYDAKQARKRAILRALREQETNSKQNPE